MKPAYPAFQFLPALCSVGLLITCISGAQAATAVSNLGEATVGTSNVENTQALRFTTGNGPGWIVNSVTVSLNRTGGADELVGITIRNDVNFFPSTATVGVAYESVSFTGSTNHTDTITTTQSEPTVLLPNTIYWLTVDASPGTTISWNYTDSPAQTGLTGWDIGFQRLNGINDGLGGWNLAGDSSASLFSMDVTAVPEPSSFALIGLGALALLRRRR